MRNDIEESWIGSSLKYIRKYEIIIYIVGKCIKYQSGLKCTFNGVDPICMTEANTTMQLALLVGFALRLGYLQALHVYVAYNELTIVTRYQVRN